MVDNHFVELTDMSDVTSDYAAAPNYEDEEAGTKSISPKEKKKTWLSHLIGNKAKYDSEIGKEKRIPISDDMSDLKTESISSSLSQVGLDYDESLLLHHSNSELSFLQPNLATTSGSGTDYRPPEVYISNVKYESRPGAEEKIRDKCSLFYAGTDMKPTKSLDKRYSLDLNQPVVDQQEWPVLMPSTPGIQADFRRSSLYEMVGGRVQIYLPTDNVRLLMDPLLEPGILSVIKDDGPMTNTPQYVLTVDDHLYRRLVKEIVARNRSCGMYFCCHESGNKASIGIALGLLSTTMLLLFIFTLVFPD